MKSAGWGVLVLALLAAGCAAPAAQRAEARLECELNGKLSFISHPWSCLREGGRVIEVSAAESAWASEAVKVGWQGRGEIKSGRLHHLHLGDAGTLRLDLPEARDACEGDYALTTPTDGDWSATCDSGQQIEARLFLNEGGVTLSAHGQDGEGRSFGFYPKPGEG